MQFNLVSRLPMWDEDGSFLSSGINVAASVPAYLGLQRRGLPMMSTSELLKPTDYQKVWRDSLTSIWQLLNCNRIKRGPDVLSIHAYSFFNLLTQVQILERFLDVCRNEHELDALAIEPAHTFTLEGSLYFGSSVYSSYFHEVAVAWAARNNIPVTIISASVASAPPASPARRGLKKIAAIRYGLNSHIRRRLLEVASGLWSTPRALYALAVNRRLVFYMVFPGSGLTSRAPSFAIDARILTKLAAFFCPADSQAGTRPVSASVLGPLSDALKRQTGTAGAILAARFGDYFEDTYSAGLATFESCSKALRLLQRLGYETAFLTPAPFVDFNSLGYLTEAFRLNGCRIGAIQHGGNYRLERRGGLAHVLTDFRAHVYFQWGTAATDEHVDCGIDQYVPAVTTGSPRTADLLRSRRSSSSLRRKPRVLYAPTFISVNTSTGVNVVWDSYINTFQQVCGILNASDLDCSVKVLKTPQMDCFDFESYPQLRVIRNGLFTDYMWQADYLVVDSLDGSPIYEALVTDKPILLYTGTALKEWDPDYIVALRQRAICFFDADSYVQGLHQFVKNPMTYVNESGVKVTDALTSKYMPPVDFDSFWRIIHNSLFGPALTARLASRNSSVSQ